MGQTEECLNGHAPALLEDDKAADLVGRQLDYPYLCFEGISFIPQLESYKMYFLLSEEFVEVLTSLGFCILPPSVTADAIVLLTQNNSVTHFKFPDTSGSDHTRC